MSARIEIDREQLAEFCRRNHIRRLSLFGSVLRDDFRPDSDVDMLVEFAGDARVGHFDMAWLTEWMGREADLNRQSLRGVKRRGNPPGPGLLVTEGFYDWLGDRHVAIGLLAMTPCTWRRPAEAPTSASRHLSTEISRMNGLQ